MFKRGILVGGVLCGLAVAVAGLRQTAAQSSGSGQSPSGRPQAPSQGPSFGAAAEKARLDKEAKRLTDEKARLERVKGNVKKQEAELKELKDKESKLRAEVVKYERQAGSLPFRCPRGASFAECTHTALKRDFQRRKDDLLSEARLKHNAADRLQRQANVLKGRLDSARQRLDYDQRVFQQDQRRYQGDRQDWLRRYSAPSGQPGSTGTGLVFDEKAKKTPRK